MEKVSSKTRALLFVDDWGFIASKASIKKIAQLLEKLEDLLVKRRKKNTVTYNIFKTKLVLFSYARQQRLNHQFQETTISFRGERVKVNRNAIC